MSVKGRVRNPLDRFYEKVDIDGPVPERRPDLGPCWLWTAATLESSPGFPYGRFSIARSTSVPSHRWAYEQHVGPIPAGLVLDHLCRVTTCVRFSHVEPVPQLQNVIRGESHVNAQRAQTHCVRDHPFDVVGYVDAQGKRRCRVCDRIRQDAYERRKRERATQGT